MSSVAVMDVSRSRLRRVIARTMCWAWNNAWLWSVGTQGLTSGLSLVTSIIAARMLGVERFGDYVLIQAGVLILFGLQGQIVAGPMMIIAGERRRSQRYFGAVARAVVFIALLIGAAASLYSLMLDRPTGHAPLVAASFIFAAGTVIQEGAKRILFALERPRAAFLCELLRQALFFIFLGVAYWKIGTSTEMLLVCVGLSTLVAGWPLLAFLKTSQNMGLQQLVAFRHWRLGGWLMLMVLVSMVHEQLVTVFAGAWIGEQAAAGLRAAQIVLGPILVFMSSLENVVPRRAAGQFRNSGEAALTGYLWRILGWSGAPIVLICLGIIIYAKELLVLFFGQDFAVFAPIVALIALCPPIQLARELGMTYLRATDRTYGIFVSFCASAVITLAVIYPLMKNYHEIGAAMSIIIGHAVSTIFVFAAVCKARAAIRREQAA